MNKALNPALLVSFLLTILVPVTGIPVHKPASTPFLLLCLVHTIIYRKKLGRKRWLLLALVLASFFTGLFGMIFDHFPLVMVLHRALSIGLVFFLAIHIFVFQKRFMK